MGAVNTIKIIHVCPLCKRENDLLCQTHMASSFDGDDTGRFCHTTYSLGQPMRWWNKNNPLYTTWKDGNLLEKIRLPDTQDMECCYSVCSACEQELYVVILFEDAIPKTVIESEAISHWPLRFSK